MKKNPERIIISRTDNLGDVILTLPLAAALKNIYPNAKIIFLGKTYTRPIIKLCEAVDEFADWSEIEKLDSAEALKCFENLRADIIIHVFPNREIAKLAFKAEIPIRIGTSHRIYHWFYCTIKVNLSRKSSDLHEAQLNLKLIEVLGGKSLYSLQEIPFLYHFRKEIIKEYKAGEKFKLMLHPGTKGSAREWGISNFSQLASLLSPDEFQIYLSGTSEEGDRFRNEFARFSHVIDVTGNFNIEEFTSFILSCDGIVAASTGPLHIAAAAGKVAIGLYAPMRPIFPKRWAPLGVRASYHVLTPDCVKCKKSKICPCIQGISPQEVQKNIEKGIENLNI